MDKRYSGNAKVARRALKGARRWLCRLGPLTAAVGLLGMAASANLISAQEATPRVSQTESTRDQQPGADAQVHTGTVSGFDTDLRLANLLAEHQYFRVESELDQLPAEQAQLYRGILANRNNKVKQSIELLEPLVDEVTRSGKTSVEKLIRKALAEDYMREGELGKAAAAYQALETRLGDKLTGDEQDEIEMPLKLLPLAQNNPPMTVDPCDPFEMQVSKNPLGLIDVPVFVDARPHSWLFDPTAPLNLIARSLAKEAGLTVSPDEVTIHTLTGRPMKVHATVIPRFTIAGRLTLHNMTAFVYEDADYAFPHSGYQVEGVLGYAALAALGSVTVTGNDTVFVHPEKQISTADKNDRLTNGTRFYLDGDQVIVALGGPRRTGEAAVPEIVGDHEERMFAIDASGQQTYLTSRYYNEQSADFAGQTMHLFTLPGQTGMPPVPAYTAETVSLTVGSVPVELHYLPVLTQLLGSAARDDVYGLLGVDALDQLREYTFDYRTMRFSIRPQ